MCKILDECAASGEEGKWAKAIDTHQPWRRVLASMTGAVRKNKLKDYRKRLKNMYNNTAKKAAIVANTAAGKTVTKMSDGAVSPSWPYEPTIFENIAEHTDAFGRCSRGQMASMACTVMEEIGGFTVTWALDHERLPPDSGDALMEEMRRRAWAGVSHARPRWHHHRLVEQVH
jgi:hypothetical protein